NRETLDAYEEVARQYAPRGLDALRARVEHAQLLSPQDIPRFGRLGVIASMQPTHATSDMRWAERRVGVERLRGAYAWASLLRSGARLAFGSDFPVESPEPLAGIYAAALREDAHGEPAGGWIPSERLTREEAVRAFTAGAAYAAFEEQVKGTIAPGKRADLVVLSRDVLTCDPNEILTTRVEMTIVGGEVVYAAR
ncbi:MAG TPA: amidohydrolase family protein, partial [Planctomycetota bacterium]|nr:amidohydrolase family protein [Planctomycetota bacterium]